MSATDIEDVVIVGAGEASARAALELRAQSFGGRITLIGEERHAPYERPPLSKALITTPQSALPPIIGDASRLDELNVTSLRGVAAVAIERNNHRVRLADGRQIAYDRLILATGARARKLTAPGAERAMTLRTFEDGVAIREAFRGARRVAIIGGGFIGLELAASARSLGCEVVVLEADSRLLRRSTPEPIASAIAAKHAREGVDISLGVRIEGVEFAENGVVVTLADGQLIAADVVVAGIGAVPATELAAEAGLAVDNGVTVDARLASSDPNIYAIGDCASFPHALFDGRRVRLEAWRNAFDQGVHVARTLLGGEQPYLALPWFWSDQYDVTLQLAGLTEADDTVVTRDLSDGAFVQFHLNRHGRLVAVGGYGPIGVIAKDVRIAERMIAARATPLAEAIRDPAVSLKKLMRV
jgi:3-phenylpropionate/trans-cinnamate dioxygenase ferredoxin reductase component